MLRMLIPIDGSEHSLRVVRHAIRLKGRLRQQPEVFLLTVQPPPPMKDLVLDARLSQVHHIEGPLKERGMARLAPALAELRAAGIECQPHVEFGEPAPVIASFADTYHCEVIIMGTRGLGAIPALLLGSVANEVLRCAPVPVLLVP